MNVVTNNPMAQRFFTWSRQTLDSLCNRPDHLQRIAVMGAGVVMYPLVVGMILIVWLGYSRTPELQSQSLSIMGWALLASMGLWGLVVVTMLGTIKGLKFDGPGGMGVEITTIADDPDIDPGTTRVTTVATTHVQTAPEDKHERHDRPMPPAPPMEVTD